MKKFFISRLSVKNQRSQGFSLIELMIVVAIMAILAAVAYPAYNKQIRKGHRVDAKSAVLEAAAREEKFFATNNQYSNFAPNLNYAALPFDVVSSGQKVYVLSIAVNTLGTPTYLITATPFGDQVNDACYTYQIDNFGTQANLLSGGASNTATDCW